MIHIYNMSVVIVQTCDGHVYKELLDATEQHHRDYCKRFGYVYHRYDGIKKGPKPWHSSFNRIYLLEEEVTKGEHDWMLYMDADAIVYDASKRVDEYLDPKYAVVVCRGLSDDPAIVHDFNIGVAFYNLRHPDIIAIISTWKHMFESVPQNVLEREQDGCFHTNGGHVDDQAMLQTIMAKLYPAMIKLYRGKEYDTFNYDGPFIKQLLRDQDTTVPKRTAKMIELVNNCPHQTSVDVIVARYKEDVTWLTKLEMPSGTRLRKLIIYNKGETIDFPNVVTLPNKGREGNTYLHHIITHYDTIADITVFIQADIRDHCVDGLTDIGYVKKMIETAKLGTSGMSWNAAPWPYGTGYDFQLGEYSGRSLVRSSYQYGGWFERFIGKFKNDPQRHLWFKSGLFAVMRDKVLQHKAAFYKHIIDDITTEGENEQGHFLERSWFYIFRGREKMPL